MLSKAQEAALLEIGEHEKELMDRIDARTRRFFPKRRKEELMAEVFMRLERIRAYYTDFELEQSRFRATIDTVYDRLIERKRFSEAAELAKRFNI